MTVGVETTVGELIRTLSEYPPNTEVVVDCAVEWGMQDRALLRPTLKMVRAGQDPLVVNGDVLVIDGAV